MRWLGGTVRACDIGLLMLLAAGKAAADSLDAASNRLASGLGGDDAGGWWVVVLGVVLLAGLVALIAMSVREPRRANLGEVRDRAERRRFRRGG